MSFEIHNLVQVADPAPQFHPHISSYNSLKASGAYGCELCALLVQCAVDQLGEDQILDLAPEHESLSFRIDSYATAGQFCIEAVTFYFGYSDAPLLMRNFQLSFRIELVQTYRELLFD